MKKLDIEKKGSLLIFSLLIIMLIVVIFFSVFPKILSELHLTNKSINQFFDIVENDINVKNIDYSKLYPFDKENVNIPQGGGYFTYNNIVNKLKENIEKAVTSSMFKYYKMVELSYIYNNLIKFNLYSNVGDSKLEIGNNYFSYIYSAKNIDTQVNNIIDFAKYLKKNNTNLLYVQAPFKMSDEIDISPVYKDFTNDKIDEFLSRIKNDIDYVDLRENIKEEKLENLSLFFQTDHHWLPKTGLWATNIISNYLNDNYSMNLKIENLNFNQYNYKTYKKIFLGSVGKDVSLAKAKPEDLVLITPKFDTKLHVKILDLGIDKIGTYEETLIDWSILKSKSYYKTNHYYAYMYGDRGLIETHNKLINNGKKILLVKDSFADAVSPFIALENEYLSIIDLRYFNGSLKTYIKEYNPDIVIVMYNGSMIAGNVNSKDYAVWNFS